MTIVQGHLGLAVMKCSHLWSVCENVRVHHQHKVLYCCEHKRGDHLLAMYIRNSRGASTVPCGTPESTGVAWLFMLSTTTH